MMMILIFKLKSRCCDSDTINGGDPSGTRVKSNQPILVITGAANSFIDSGTISADHLSEAVPRVDELGKEYVIAPSKDGDYVKIVGK